jgi:hypothetical protein
MNEIEEEVIVQLEDQFKEIEKTISEAEKSNAIKDLNVKIDDLYEKMLKLKDLCIEIKFSEYFLNVVEVLDSVSRNARESNTTGEGHDSRMNSEIQAMKSTFSLLRREFLNVFDNLELQEVELNFGYLRMQFRERKN